MSFLDLLQSLCWEAQSFDLIKSMSSYTQRPESPFYSLPAQFAAQALAPLPSLGRLSWQPKSY